MSKEQVEQRIQEIRRRLLTQKDRPSSDEVAELKAELHELELKLQ